ncbi:MAG: hypothetical protein AAFU56_07560, partial [Pseudomonadota bacterium]
MTHAPGWKRQKIIGVCAALGILLAPAGRTAQAAEPAAEVKQLNKRAMRNYTDLKVGAAEAQLRRALKIAERGQVQGEALGRTYLNLAILHIAGKQDSTAGLSYCKKALLEDPNIQLDPALSTPEVKAIFDEARGADSGPPASGKEPNAGHGGAPFEGPGNIPHTPVPEQLNQTGVPVFIEVPQDAPVGPIYLFYKGVGMQGYRRVEMKRVPGGFG